MNIRAISIFYILIFVVSCSVQNQDEKEFVSKIQTEKIQVTDAIFSEMDDIQKGLDRIDRIGTTIEKYSRVSEEQQFFKKRTKNFGFIFKKVLSIEKLKKMIIVSNNFSIKHTIIPATFSEMISNENTFLPFDVAFTGKIENHKVLSYELIFSSYNGVEYVILHKETDRNPEINILNFAQFVIEQTSVDVLSDEIIQNEKKTLIHSLIDVSELLTPVFYIEKGELKMAMKTPEISNFELDLDPERKGTILLNPRNIPHPSQAKDNSLNVTISLEDYIGKMPAFRIDKDGLWEFDKTKMMALERSLRMCFLDGTKECYKNTKNASSYYNFSSIEYVNLEETPINYVIEDYPIWGRTKSPYYIESDDGENRWHEDEREYVQLVTSKFHIDWKLALKWEDM